MYWRGKEVSDTERKTGGDGKTGIDQGRTLVLWGLVQRREVIRVEVPIFLPPVTCHLSYRLAAIDLALKPD